MGAKSFRFAPRPIHRLLPCNFENFVSHGDSWCIDKCLSRERVSVSARIPHVLRGFDRWDELESDIGNTDKSNDAPENIVRDMLVEED